VSVEKSKRSGTSGQSLWAS